MTHTQADFGSCDRTHAWPERWSKKSFVVDLASAVTASTWYDFHKEFCLKLGGTGAVENRADGALPMTSLAKAHRRITIAAIAVAATVLTALAGVGWWAAGKIDDRSIAHEQKAIRTGLGDLATVVALVADGVVGSVECIPLQAAQILRKQIA